MATYVNDLRLKEIATGDEAGTWGTSTNTNLELIGEALGYGTQDCFSSDADATTTVADGATDPARAMYFKVTSSATLTAGRTLTIAPNTISRVMFIENATTGSQVITISQGTGGNVAIANGKTAVVYLDGAGSGAAVVDAMALVDPGITDTLAEVLAAGNTTGGTDIQFSAGDNITNASGDFTIDIAGDITLDAGGGDFVFSDDGTEIGRLRNVASGFQIQSSVSNKDLLFVGSDAGVDVTALTLDMSAAGAATFNSTIALGDSKQIFFGAGSDGRISFDGTDTLNITASNGTATTLNLTANNFTIGGASALISGTANTSVVINEASGDVDFRVESNDNTHALFVDAGNNRVGVLTNAPSSPLEVAGGSAYPTTKLSRDGGSAATQGNLTTGFSAIGYSGGTGADTYMVSEHGFGFAVNAGTNALVITDGGKIGINESSPDNPLHVTTSSAGDILTLESTDAGTGTGPSINLYRNSSSPAANDLGPALYFRGENSVGGQHTYGSIYTQFTDVTDAAEDGNVIHQISLAGTPRTVLSLLASDGSVVINDESQNVDFRVESDANTHMLFVDAGSDHVNIGTSTDYGGSLNVNKKLIVRALDGEAANDYVAAFQNQEATDSQSFGVSIAAGSTSSDIALNVVDHDASNVLLRVLGNGATNIGGAVTLDSSLTIGGDTSITGSSSGSTVLTLTSNALADTPLMVFQRTGGAVAGKLAYEDTNTAIAFGTTTQHELKFLTNNTARGQFTGNGNLLLQTDTVAYAGTALNIGDTSDSQNGVQITTSTTGNGYILFGDGSGADSYRGQIHYQHSDDTFKFNTAGTVRAKFGSSEIVFNDVSADTDFRVESNGSTHMLFVDASTNRVGINDTSPDFRLDVLGGNGDQFRLNNGGERFTQMYWANNNASKGAIWVDGTDSKFELYAYAGYAAAIHSNATERAIFKSTGEAVFNENSNDYDFRVESNNNTHALFVDAGATTGGRVGIKTSAPDHSFSVQGAASFYMDAAPFYNIKATDYGTTATGLFLGSVRGGLFQGVGTSYYYNSGYFRAQQTDAAALNFYNGKFTFYADTVTVDTNYLPTTIAEIGPTGTVFNENSADADFRVESNSNTQALLVDAGGDFVAMGNTTKTPVSNYADQHGFGFDAQTGATQIASDGIPLELGRTTTGGANGLFIQMRQQSNVVGVIGNYNGVPYIGYGGGSGGGIMFNGQSIEPTALGATRSDGTNDIGSGTYRWRNAYLSGSIYLGGTTAANALDDYEEGTWTPTVQGSGGGAYTYSGVTARYTKIGNLVTLFCQLVNITTSGSGHVGYLQIANTPFTKRGDTFTSGSVALSSVDFTNNMTYATVEFITTGSTSTLYIRQHGDNYVGADLPVTAINSGTSDMTFTIQYVVA